MDPERQPASEPPGGAEASAEVPIRPGRRTGRVHRVLPWSAALAWPSSVALVGVLEAQHRAGGQHFSFAVGVPLLVAIAASTLAAVAVSPWLILRRPGRRRAAVWAATALVPATLWAATGTYAHSNFRRRHVPSNFPMDLAKRMGAMLMEAELRVRYTEQLQGPRVVMFYRGTIARPDAHDDLARMEAFLEQLERRYGRPIRTRIHWVRGELLGQRGVALYGLALGSILSQPPPEGQGDDGGGLSGLDKHEIAHAVIHQWMPPDADPPALLSEGWAEVVAVGPPPLIRRNFGYGSIPPGQVLATLMSPQYYHRHTGPVYAVGRHLVHFLIARHGHEKFFELYRTIRPDTVDTRFYEIYGVELAAIEREMFQTRRRTRPE